MKSFDQLFEELAARNLERPEGSRSTELLEQGVHAIGKKIVEEAAEVWMAAEHESDEQLARLVAAGRVAHLGSAAAHQGDRPVAGLLQPAQHHDRHEMADMQRVRGAVVADVAGDAARLARQRVEPGRVGDLMEEAALLEDAQQV